MAAIAAYLDNRSAFVQLRRAVPRGQLSVLTCRTTRAVQRLLVTRVVDAIALGPLAAHRCDLAQLRLAFPVLPLFVFGPFRPDDADQLLEYHRLGVQCVIVEGVDDAVLGEVLSRRSLTAARRQALAAAPRLLRLTEEIQLQTWLLLVSNMDRAYSTAALAKSLAVSREHLSRQFGAGGAPNLKRVIDFLRVVTACQLLANPGYTLPVVSRLLGFATPSHLNATARRIGGTRIRDLVTEGPSGVLARFVRGHTRSRE